MDKKVKWLRISYWTAAIADFIVAGVVLIPGRMGVAEHVYPMGLMSAVAFSWAVMLVIADRRPVERRWILVPTMLVVALLGGVALHAGLTGLLPFVRALPPIIASVIIFSLLLFSHIKCRDLTPG